MDNKNENSIVSILLDTRNADNSDLSSPVWTLNPSIESIEAFKIKSMIIPISSYNIDTYNNSLKIFQNISGSTSTNTAVLPSQNYNSSNIGGLLTTTLNSQGNLYMTASFQTSSNKLTLVSTTGSFYIMDVSNDCYENLGITTSTTLVSSYTGGNCVDLSGVKTIHLQSNSLDGIQIPGLNNRILGSIPIEESVNSIAYYADDGNDYIDTNISSISQIRIDLKDEKFRKLVQRNHYSINLNLKTG